MLIPNLEVFCGPMFSGKTDALIDRYEAASSGAVAFKPAADTRSAPDRIVSHSGRSIRAQAATRAAVIMERAGSAGLVLIDEVQFFDSDLVAVVAALRDEGTAIVAAGLDLDFRRESFETTAALSSVASRVVRLASECARCGAVARYTQRLVNGVPAPLSEPRLVVGDADIYEPRCGRCWSTAGAVRADS
jgi:thymidine kinase